MPDSGTIMEASYCPQLHELPITENDLDLMFLHIIRVPEIFVEALQLLAPDHFERTTEPHYAVLWNAISQLHGQYGRFSYETISTYIANVLDATPDVVSTNMRTTLLQADQQGIIYRCIHCPEAELVPENGQNVLRKFLRERRVIKPLRVLLNQGDGRTYISDFPELTCPL